MTGLFDRLLFEDRTLFHYFAHAASLVLTEDYPIHWGTMRPYQSRTDAWGARIAAWLRDNQILREQVLEQIAVRGPLRSRDFPNTARTDWRSSGWTEGRSVNRMLDFLWVEGALTVAGRAGGERLWDLSERWFPDWTPREQLSTAERSDRAVEHALRALGVATPGQVSKHFLRGRHPDLRGSFRRLTASGAVLPVTVRGWKGDWQIHRDSLPLVEAPWQPRTVLLSPFDNLVADRQRTRELFGFDYAIEIYRPGNKAEARLLRDADPRRGPDHRHRRSPPRPGFADAGRQRHRGGPGGQVPRWSPLRVAGRCPAQQGRD